MVVIPLISSACGKTPDMLYVRLLSCGSKDRFVNSFFDARDRIPSGMMISENRPSRDFADIDLVFVAR